MGVIAGIQNTVKMLQYSSPAVVIMEVIPIDNGSFSCSATCTDAPPRLERVIGRFPEEVFAAATTSTTASTTTAAPAAAAAPYTDVHHEMVLLSADPEMEAALQSGRALESAKADMLASQPVVLSTHLMDLDPQLILLRACLHSLYTASWKIWRKNDIQSAENVALGFLERLCLPEVMEIVRQTLNCYEPPRLERVITHAGQQVSAADKAFLQSSDNVNTITEHVSVGLLRQHISELLEKLRRCGLTSVSEHLVTEQERSGYHYFVIWLTRMATSHKLSGQ